ncbi:Two-component response regulator ARR22 [Arabidopsis thaliana]|uniref:Two-component response regulator ARR22 n=4 Tax=Arabidopsis TaxID=3701 RepID=ARR22_ARATH|nr:response regulator 22 [Arabidopsis thaliana]NP_187078.1 response regulator 22 [Arabidopsis thaliana]NP_850511.1 response regulator 22 [Arabidopsis thaliana]Q9M8Y4.1 RecName: Full=Two-component response regulator ARR22 [Arabidopsis thaliana]KAG7623969.1 Signal transduction response regulator receiver domain [Arabidopsis thaliana x Arabidopsis arenosa]KAG7629982.1 Signal transduction response regulator receiver domain [Arabidopsis suecica]AAF26786.1 putative response regulator protein (recei|eukprot:NP_001078102.1 response regulator 22 [Arabidopsis thaliana]
MATKSTGGTEKTKSIEVKKKLINVLIVDDDPLNRRLHEMIIKTIGGISQTAKNGEEAVILHRDGEASFDLILMDKEMPERDGVSTTKKLREMKVTSMIVGVTSVADQEEERKAFMEAGLNHCLEKPLTKAKIFPLISHLFDA